MAMTEGNSNFALNGATPVTLVASPAASTRRLIRNITVHNRDTAAVTLTVRYVDDATTRQLYKVTLQPDSTWVCNTVIVLADTNDSVTALLSGAAATTNPDGIAAWADVS